MSGNSDIDKLETQEWLDALASVIREDGTERAEYLLSQLSQYARESGLITAVGIHTPYVNTLSTTEQPVVPGDRNIEKQITALLRWNAVAMVLKATRQAPELGGHIASYASAATLYEVGFNHFFHAPTAEHGGDLLYIQGHSSPGIYARAFLEGRFTEAQLSLFRQEIGKDGLSSYPHPHLMGEFWQFPTVSMGLGPIQAIYQARFLKYLHQRGIADTSKRKVWVFCGDGEMDEPESIGALSIAAREQLDNLIFVVNCNLQRLDGPVRGNGKIIQELEGIFKGAGWNVLKVIWGKRWDPLFEKDKSGLLIKRMEEAVDGDYQNYKAKDGAYVREYFFGKYPELKALVADMSDEAIWELNRGGHDVEKVYAAYQSAVNCQGMPTVILAKTVKGYGMGSAGEGLNITHQQKKMSTDDLKAFRDRFNIPISDKDIADAPFYRPDEKSPEMQYLRERREALGGYLPQRRRKSSSTLSIPSLDEFKVLTEGTGEREISTTMAFVRLLGVLLKNKNMGKYIVPMVPDESRTFGMEGLFRQLGIYAPSGQLYTPVDSEQMMYYREESDGQILQEGLNEPGAFASWMAVATSYSTNDVPMIPFYIYYSMFGFQRIGDLAWAAADMHARGFLLGATAGRTTLAGEGLQHQDGHSHVLASTIPNCVSYDPTYSYELAVIIQDGLRRMYHEQEDVYYYITVMNENYVHPAMPDGVEEGIIKGMYLLQTGKKKNKATVQLFGSGTILQEVLAAATILEDEYSISADVWSVTSFNELGRQARDIERKNRLNPEAQPELAYVTACLTNQKGPVIAATDYIRSYAEQLRAYIPQQYVVLGTDGFGRSDTRRALRQFFEVDAKSIVVAALNALADEGEFSKVDVKKAMQKWGIDVKKPNPLKE